MDDNEKVKEMRYKAHKIALDRQHKPYRRRNDSSKREELKRVGTCMICKNVKCICDDVSEWTKVRLRK